jgi:hypothetical protein
LGDRGRRTEKFKASLGYTVRPCLKQQQQKDKNQAKIQVWNEKANKLITKLVRGEFNGK